MKIFGKKGIITHPGFLFIGGVILGIVVAYLWARQIIAVPSPFCK